MAKDLEIRQWERYEGDEWWKWAVWVEGDDEMLDRIEVVEWALHPTFPNPIRLSRDRANKFRLETGGWGVFPINARVKTKDGQSFDLRHMLSLHYPDGEENTA